jgi:hypothetical protein
MPRGGLTRRIIITGASVLLASLASSAPAGAATLRPEQNQWDSRWFIVYEAGPEANHVKLTGYGGHVFYLQDPNVAIATRTLEPPAVTTVGLGDLPVYLPVRQTYNCVSPRGRGDAICVATAGTGCSDGGCYSEADPFFRWTTLSLGAGDDQANLLAGSAKSESATELGWTVRLFAGPGNDRLDTRNNAPDIIDCGDGTDTVTADFKDSEFVGCETITRSWRLP